MKNMNKEQWKELDEKTLEIRISEPGPGHFQVWGVDVKTDDGEGDEYLLAEWNE